MAKIVIEEFSKTHVYNTSDGDFATIAMPISASWGPCFTGYGDDKYEDNPDDPYDDPVKPFEWSQFDATNNGLANFLSTYRGPSSEYTVAEDYSFFYAQHLLTLGYNILCARVGSGSAATTNLTGATTVRAKYPGSYGNYLQVTIKPTIRSLPGIYTLTVYEKKPGASRTRLEGLRFTTDLLRVDEQTIFWEEVGNTSRFVEITSIDSTEQIIDEEFVPLTNGTDYAAQTTVDTDEQYSLAFKRTNTSKKDDSSMTYEGTENPVYYPIYKNLTVTSIPTNASGEPIFKHLWLIPMWYVHNGTNEWRWAVVGSPTPDMVNTEILPYVVDGDGYYAGVNNKAGSGLQVLGTSSIIAWLPLDEEADAAPQKILFPIGTGNIVVTFTLEANWHQNMLAAYGSPEITEDGHGYKIEAVQYLGGQESPFVSAEAPTLASDDSVNNVIERIKERQYSTGLVSAKYADSTAYLPDNYIGAMTKWVAEMPYTLAAVECIKQERYNKLLQILPLLTDRFSYDFDALILSGWDDQDINFRKLFDIVNAEDSAWDTAEALAKDFKYVPSPLHVSAIENCAKSKCGAAMLDCPRNMHRNLVYDDRDESLGYAQMLSKPYADIDGLVPSHAALYAIWARVPITGLSFNPRTPPSIISLMLLKSQLATQAIRTWWILPNDLRSNVKPSAVDYRLSEQMYQTWQNNDLGPSVNPIFRVPNIGTVVFGNSTLFDKPQNTYNALQNWSTRRLFNRIKQRIFNIGLSITFNYNNRNAYTKFYAGVQPLLSSMEKAGAIEGWKIEMSPDINGLDQVNANTVIGKVHIIVPGVINNIFIDLIAYPPGTDLDMLTSG